MDIQTKTKFNIGQEVFICIKGLRFIKGKYKDCFSPVKTPITVTQIIVYLDIEGLQICYNLSDNHFIYSKSYQYSEEQLFNSFEDAEEWCNKQNKLYE